MGLRDSAFGAWSVLGGVAAGLAISLILWLVLKLEDRYGERAGELPGAAGFDADDAMLLVPLAGWSGLSQGLLAAAAVGAPVFAFVLFLWFRRGQGRS